uniref:Uncharacterized protein n=1 Tax=Anguilla anguilla TaxID=7936 RepID=A0A0E9PRG1_ANGAN
MCHYVLEIWTVTKNIVDLKLTDA